jgi:signal transduction histidine kinase
VLVAPFVGYAIAPFGWAAGNEPFAVLLLALATVPMLAGAVRRLRTEAADQDASDRALADTMIEHVVRGERARIARELHDVVAHHISMIAVQADTARLATPGMPALGAERLVAIGDTARTALTEMRRLLGVLREDAGAEPARAPQPGLAQLNELIDEARASAGSSTRLILQGHAVPLAAGLQLTAYRIVQEALTNARRHAPGAAVDVELDYGPDVLRLRIRDNGPGHRDTGPRGTGARRLGSRGPGGRGSGGWGSTGRASAGRGGGGGHGLVGMRERATMAGGELRAGPAPNSGFLVEAVLPLTGAGRG